MSGIVLWTGASPVDGSPLVCIATLGSRNRKTGAMAQTWIMRADVAPHVAVATGMDVACCDSTASGTSRGVPLVSRHATTT